jgi:hypothetical protein
MGAARLLTDPNVPGELSQRELQLIDSDFAEPQTDTEEAK